jgi:succinate-semialdehyde dehydrogenase/glutarate-semialdehyde dehydrogenase
MYPDLNLFIGGKWRKTGADMPVLNPATEEELGRLPCASTSDLDDALEAAVQGFAHWRRTAPRARADVILRAAALMRERQEEIATAITLEHGTPLSLARLEVIRGAEFFNHIPDPGDDFFSTHPPNDARIAAVHAEAGRR